MSNDLSWFVYLIMGEEALGLLLKFMNSNLVPLYLLLSIDTKK